MGLAVEEALTTTGGKNAVRARGWTGCIVSSLSALIVVRFESDRRRVVTLSVRLRRAYEDMLPSCRTEAYED